MAVGFIVDDEEDGRIVRIPIGYRFTPTDQELIMCYLWNKVLRMPIPAQVIPDMKESKFYSMPPNTLVENFLNERRSWCWSDTNSYFFVREDVKSFLGRKYRRVGDGIGSWKCSTETPICNSNGNIVAFKIYLTYFDRDSNKTDWTMEEYRLSKTSQINEWVLGKIKGGEDYAEHF